MSGERIRLGPVVASLLVTSTVVWVLLETVLTLPAVSQALQFDPGLALSRPWTFVTYLFVHSGLASLGANLLLLASFGPPVERRMGGQAFLLYYLACGIGTAFFALGLTSFLDLPPLLGAEGAVLGTALAFWLAWPEARLVLDPLPLRPRVQTLILVFALYEVGAALLLKGNQHVAYLGGFATGYLISRAQMISARRRRTPPAPIPARPVMKPVTVRQGGPPSAARPASPPKPPPHRRPEELDRLLDKISASGMQSLTEEEREILDWIAKRKRKDPG